MGDEQLEVDHSGVSLAFLEWLPSYPEPAEWARFAREHPWVQQDQLYGVLLRLLRSGVLVNDHHPGDGELARHVRWPRPRPRPQSR